MAEYPGQPEVQFFKKLLPMNERTAFWYSAPTTDSTGRRSAGSEEKRQDWGYTNQYRRMMQKPYEKRENLEKTQ